MLHAAVSLGWPGPPPPHVPLGQGRHFVRAGLENVPVSQREQLVPGDVLTLPGAHATHARLPRSPCICLPASQTLHTVCPLRPSVNIPVAQLLHAGCMASSLNMSCGHLVQLLGCLFPVLAENVPGGHPLVTVDERDGRIKI